MSFPGVSNCDSIGPCRVFLEDMQGDPNVRTGKGETALHLASRVPWNVHARTSSAASRRAACLALLVLWRGSEGEAVLLDAQDQVRGWSCTTIQLECLC